MRPAAMLAVLLAVIAAAAAQTTSTSGSTCVVVDSKAYVIGGNTGGLTVLDLESSVAMPVPAQEQLQRTHHASAQHGKHIYIVGGRSRSRLAPGVLLRLDTDDLSLEVLRPTGGGPEPREYMSAAFVGDKLYVTGGRNQQKECSGDVWEYDPRTNAWSYRLDVGARYAHTAVGVNGTLYLFGGWPDPDCNARTNSLAVDVAAAAPKPRDLSAPEGPALQLHTPALQYPYMIFLGENSRYFYNFEGNTWSTDAASDGLQRSTHCAVPRGWTGNEVRLTVLQHQSAPATSFPLSVVPPLPVPATTNPRRPAEQPATGRPSTQPPPPPPRATPTPDPTILPIGGSPFIEMKCEPAQCQRRPLPELPPRPSCEKCNLCPQPCSPCTDRVTSLVASFEVRVECEINRLRAKKERAKCDSCARTVAEWKRSVTKTLGTFNINCTHIEDNIKRLQQTLKSAEGLESDVGEVLTGDYLSTQLRTALDGHVRAKELYCGDETKEIREGGGAGADEFVTYTPETVQDEISRTIDLQANFARRVRELVKEYEQEIGLTGLELDGHCVEQARDFLGDVRTAGFKDSSCDVTHNIRCDLRTAPDGRPPIAPGNPDCPCP